MPDTRHCPACGAANACSLAEPRSATQACWCHAVNIDPAVLQALPEAQRGQACLCQRCATRADRPAASSLETAG